jgi:hypothetical protein
VRSSELFTVEGKAVKTAINGANGSPEPKVVKPTKSGIKYSSLYSNIQQPNHKTNKKGSSLLLYQQIPIP